MLVPPRSAPRSDLADADSTAQSATLLEARRRAHPSGRHRRGSVDVAVRHAAAWIALHGLVAACLVGVCVDMAHARTEDVPPLPPRLSETGLFVPGTNEIDPKHLSFSPQYPLWSDGAIKRRWMNVPPGATIDASNPDAWVFPPGTRLWKEFGYARPIETRYIERLADGSWRLAAYVWNADGTDAMLAPAEGIAALTAPSAPGGRYAIPSRDDCRTCHEGAAVPVLGVGALQLSPDRDPLAPHAEPPSASHVDLPGLVARGILRNLPRTLLDRPPRVTAGSPVARAALGYMHGNCGHCHNDVGSLASLDLSLAQETALPDTAVKVLRSTLGHSSDFRPRDAQPVTQRVVPGSPDASVLMLRARSRNPTTQMPPLGTRLADDEGLALIDRWIRHALPPQRKEIAP